MNVSECGRKKLKKGAPGSLAALTVNEMRERLKARVNAMKRSELCEAMMNLKPKLKPKLKLKPKQTGLLAYNGANSCYIDSTLMALFQVDHAWLNRHFLSKAPVYLPLRDLVSKIQAELQSIYKHIHGAGAAPLKCSNIRKMFTQFDKEYQVVYKRRVERIEWRRTQQEPRDVLDILLRIFDVNASSPIGLLNN